MHWRLAPIVLMLAAALRTPAASLPPLRVSDNHRFWVTAEGKPFFWLAYTAWQLIHDLDEAEMRRYFPDRRDKGGEFENRDRRTFDPPGEEQPGNDWVLMLE